MYLLQSDLLSSQAGLRHFISTKSGGVSLTPFASLNLSFKVGDKEEYVLENRNRLANAIGAKKLVIPVQTHSANVSWVTEENVGDSHENTDGLLTKLSGVAIAVMSADCVPLLFYAPDIQAVAAAHAGWRGTVQRIATQILLQLKHAGADLSKTFAYIGPSISQPVYEVGGEVITEMQKFPKPDKILAFTSEAKACCNLWEANLQLLLEAGVLQQNIELSGMCTATRTDLFFSARKEKPDTGRFAAGIMLV